MVGLGSPSRALTSVGRDGHARLGHGLQHQQQPQVGGDRAALSFRGPLVAVHHRPGRSAVESAGTNATRSQTATSAAR